MTSQYDTTKESARKGKEEAAEYSTFLESELEISKVLVFLFHCIDLIFASSTYGGHHPPTDFVRPPAL
jgi:hypothetical protein